MTVTAARRWTGRLTAGLLLLVAVAAAGLFLLPKALGYDLYVITTGSMRGTADPGALVIADRVPVAELAVGDVITYSPPPGSGVDHLVTHRIVDVGQDDAGAVAYTTRGDANAADDPWTFALDSPVQARMQWTVPSAGWPVLWLTDPQTRMLAFGVPAALIALLALKDLVLALLPVRRPVEAQVVDLSDAEPQPEPPVDRDSSRELRPVVLA